MITLEFSGVKITIDKTDVELRFLSWLFSPQRETKKEEKVTEETRKSVTVSATDITMLTERMGYKRDGNDVVFCHIKDGKPSTLFRLSTDELRDLFEELPEKSTKVELFDAAKKLGIRIPLPHYQLVFHFYDKDINYDAHLRKEGNLNVLVKEEFSLRDEMEKQLEVDNELTRDAV